MAECCVCPVRLPGKGGEVSYDVYVRYPSAPGHEDFDWATAWEGNMTSNVSPMWRAAGANLAEMDGRRAGDCVTALRTAIADIDARPEFYKPMEPDNGWGSVDGCTRFLGEILRACEAHPGAVLSVSR